MNLSQVISHHADRRPDAVAWSMGSEVRTFGELRQRMQLLAGALREGGAERGTVVAVLLHNRIELLELMCATAHIGSIFMPLNWRLAPAELAYICTHAGAGVVVSEPELSSQIDTFAADVPRASLITLGAADGRWAALADLAARAAPVIDTTFVGADDVHRLMYTSGTTSRPKGVMITYANLYWKCTAQIMELEITHNDRGLACGPLYHVGALDLTTTNMLYAGGSTHILRRFDSAEVVDAIEQRGITNVWLAPAMVNALVASRAAEGRDMSTVRLVVDGGEKMPPPLIERVLETFPNAWFADAYGLTETVSGDTFLDKGKTVAKVGSVGRPVLHTEIAVVDDDDRPVAAGIHGEIVIRGPKVTPGYWRDAEGSAVAHRGGWFHTGDIGYLDADGFLFIVDRLKDMIVSGGENVASLEVERVLFEHSDVREVAVVASPDARWIEVPVAYVVMKEGAVGDDAELAAFCAERLAKFKCPKAFRFVAELPRNPAGKVLKRELREREFAASAERR
jgi:acyl-CoA synthetase (AMP-forming)/AMP-acid ligase II